MMIQLIQTNNIKEAGVENQETKSNLKIIKILNKKTIADITIKLKRIILIMKINKQKKYQRKKDRGLATNQVFQKLFNLS